MANRYWRGGSGTWDTTSTTNWGAVSGGAGGASVPTAADSVFFDQAGTYTVTCTNALTCLDITVSAGTVTFAAGTSPTLAISGSMSLLAGTVWSAAIPSTFNATTTGKTVTTNGVTLSSVTFNGVGGEWSLGSTLTISPTLTTTLTNGALVLNGFNLSTGIFSSSNSNTRSISFGSNFIYLVTTTAATTVVSMATTTNLTVSGTGGFSAAMSVTRTFISGTTANNGLTGAPNLFLTSGSSIPTISTTGWWNTLDFTGTTCNLGTTNLNLKNLILATGAGTYNSLTATMRDTGTITNLGKGIGSLIINHSGTTTLTSNLACALATSYTQTAGTIDFAGFNLTCTGTASFSSGTLLNIGTITCTTFTVSAGTFNFISGTITPSSSFSVSGTGEFIYDGGTLGPVATFTQSTTTSVVTFNSSYSLTSTGSFNFNAGTLNLNSTTLTTGVFNSSNSSARTINFGATGSIVLTGSATTVLDMGTMSSLVMTGSRDFFANSSSSNTFSVGGTAGGYITNGVKLTFTGSGAGTQTFAVPSGATRFDSLNFGTFSGSTVNQVTVNSIYLSAAQVTIPTLTLGLGSGGGTGTINTNGRTIALATINYGGTGGGVTLLSDVQISSATTTHTAGYINLNGFNLSCVTWVSTGSTTRSIDFGSNYIYLTTAAAAALALSMATATSFTASGTGGFSTAMVSTKTFTVGTTGAPTVAPNLFLTSGASVPTLTTAGFFGNLNFTGSTCNPGTTALTLTGLTLAGGTYTGMTVTLNGTGTLNGNSKTIAALTINHSGTTTVTGSLTSSGNLTLTQGAIAFSGSPTLTIPSFISVGPTTRSITGSGTISVSTAWTVTNGTGFTGTGYTISMTRATAKTFAGGTGGAAYGTLVQAGAGALTISGSNTFDDIQATTVPSTITYTAGTTQTLANFTLSGTSGNLVTINSTVAGTQFTMTKPNGTVTVNYLSIQDSNVTGGAYWTTTTSTFVSNNTGWNIGPSSSVNGQFMAFFF